MKKKVEKILVVLLAALLALNLSGCFLLEDDDYYDDYEDAYEDYYDRDYNNDDYDDDDEGLLGGLFGLLDELLGDDEDYDDESWSSGNRGSGGWFDDDDDYDYDDDDSWNSRTYTSSDGGYSLPGNTDYSQYTFGGELGSAKEMEGVTLVVSVFMDDSKTSWNFNDSDDVRSRSNALKYMKIATDWISEQAADYGVSMKFIYNWESYTDLYFEGKLTCDMTDENSEDPYYDQMAWIDENVDSQSLMDKYGADDIIYMLYINTPMSNECVSATYNYAEDDYYPYEVVSIYVHSYYEEETPAAYAHEILHTYGAPDLYLVDSDGTNYGITQSFVSRMESTNSNDIMYTTYDCDTQEAYYSYISNEFSTLDAYYVGLTDDYSEAQKLGFERSQH